MSCLGSTSRLFRPFEDGQLRIAAVNDDPANGVLTFFATDFTFVDGADQLETSQENGWKPLCQLLRDPIRASADPMVRRACNPYY